MIADLAHRFPQNPLLSPVDLLPSRKGLTITCLLNPGVFTFQEKIWLLVRVAERPVQKEGKLSFPILSFPVKRSIKGKPLGETPADRAFTSRIEIVEIDYNDPDLIAIDSRVITYKGVDYLTTLSHFRLFNSEDGVRFKEAKGYPYLRGESILEAFGIEDCRVVLIENKYYLSYTAVSENGVGVGLRTTEDWKNFELKGMILPPHNKDCAIFDKKINGLYHALHRPSSVGIGGNYIWLAQSPDGVHWGNHKCILKTREGFWDSLRIGGGAAPIKTDRGWLEIYHGANENHQYCLGAFLMDIDKPEIVIGRTENPIMVPQYGYETDGFFGNVVFTNGFLVDGDELTIYYGAADTYICGAKFSIKSICSHLVYG